MLKKVKISSRYMTVVLVGLLLVVILSAYNGGDGRYSSVIAADTSKWPASFGFGKPATEQQIDSLNIDVRADGLGLPPGVGTTAEGKLIFAAKCASCHGANGKASAGEKLPAPDLVSDSASKVKAIGNYWPYASTIFDYVRRAMPYNAPGSLTDNEVYSLTAYLLSTNHIIKPDYVLTQQTLREVQMPARKLFIPDDRRGGPEVR